MPYSGNASAYGVVGRAMVAYFDKLNREQGGINGRKIKLTSLDDGYSPPKTVEQTRKLVEQDDVLLIFGTLGTPTNTAIHKYLNAKRVPHLLVTSGADKWADPKSFPWTVPGMVSYQTEAAAYGRYLRETRPDAKVALLLQNDDFGKDYAAGFRRGLGDAAKRMIVAEATYEVTDPTVDSQILALKASGADAFFSITLGKFSSQAISRAYDMGWRPREFFVPTSSTSIKGILGPAGLEKSVGIVTSSISKSVSDPQWNDDPGMKGYLAFLREYVPAGDPNDTSMVGGYNSAMILAHVLEAMRRRPEPRQRIAPGYVHTRHGPAHAAARHQSGYGTRRLPALPDPAAATLRRQVVEAVRRSHLGLMQRVGDGAGRARAASRVVGCPSATEMGGAP